jgi:hypothetical protein
MTNNPLTEQDFCASDCSGCALKKVQSAKRLAKEKIKAKVGRLPASCWEIEEGKLAAYEECLGIIDACFQIKDGDDKDGK